jgi:hypothetical protein
MEIRLILFKEIGFGISLNNQRDGSGIYRLPFGRKNQEDDFSFLK